MDRAGRWERAVLHGHVLEHPTPQAAGTEYFFLNVEDVPATGSRPDRLAGVRPQERVQQHFVDQIVDTAPELPILDVFVPLMGEQLVDVLRFFDTLCPCCRAGHRRVQDLPRGHPFATLVSRAAAGGTVGGSADDRISFLVAADNGAADTPVPGGGGGRNVGLQGFLPEQSSTATLSSAERISERIVEQIVDIPVSGGGLHDFCTGQSSSSVLRSPTDWLNTEDVAFQCFFFSQFFPAQ